MKLYFLLIVWPVYLHMCDLYNKENKHVLINVCLYTDKHHAK